jgi:geranyl diphosphate synthase
VIELLSRVLEHLVSGEIMQMTGEPEARCSFDYYVKKTYNKTASLIANSCKSIAILAGQPPEVAVLAYDYGRHLVRIENAAILFSDSMTVDDIC